MSLRDRRHLGFITAFAGALVACADVGDPPGAEGACGGPGASPCDAAPTPIDAGETDGGMPDAAPRPTTLDLAIEGQTMTVTGTWFSGSGALFFLNFVGPGFAAGSDINLILKVLGTGCGSGESANDIWLRPDIENTTYLSQYQSDSPSCGLKLTELPATHGRAVGSFEGRLDSIGGGPAQVELSLTFDVPFP